MWPWAPLLTRQTNQFEHKVDSKTHKNHSAERRRYAKCGLRPREEFRLDAVAKKTLSTLKTNCIYTQGPWVKRRVRHYTPNNCGKTEAQSHPHPEEPPDSKGLLRKLAPRWCSATEEEPFCCPPGGTAAAIEQIGRPVSPRNPEDEHVEISSGGPTK